MEITWLGHSCFLVQSGGYRIVLDPYAAGSVSGLAPVAVEAHKVLCSHEHFDHNAREAVTLLPEREDPFTARTLSVFHDDAQGAKRGKNAVTILKAENMTVVHLGDLGHMLSKEQIEEMGRVDLLLIPTGGHYTIDAAQAAELAEKIGARVTVPMHYRGQGFGFDVLSEATDFLKRRKNVRFYDGSTLEITPDTSEQTAVLTPLNLEKA